MRKEKTQNYEQKVKSLGYLRYLSDFLRNSDPNDLTPSPLHMKNKELLQRRISRFDSRAINMMGNYKNFKEDTERMDSSSCSLEEEEPSNSSSFTEKSDPVMILLQTSRSDSSSCDCDLSSHLSKSPLANSGDKIKKEIGHFSKEPEFDDVPHEHNNFMTIFEGRRVSKYEMSFIQKINGPKINGHKRQTSTM